MVLALNYGIVLEYIDIWFDINNGMEIEWIVFFGKPLIVDMF